MCLDEHLMLSWPLPWRLGGGGADAVTLQIFFQLWLSQATWKTASHIWSAGWRLGLVWYLFSGTVWCTHSQGTLWLLLETQSSGKGWFNYWEEFWQPGIWKSYNKFGPRKKSVTIRCPGSTEPEQSTTLLKTSTELGLALKVIALNESSLKQQINGFFSPHSSRGSGMPEQLSCMVLVQCLSWGCSQTTGRGYSHLKTRRRLEDPLLSSFIWLFVESVISMSEYSSY